MGDSSLSACIQSIVAFATQPLSAANGADGALASDAFDDVVVEPLIVAFAVVMGHELRERMTEVPLTERNQMVQAFPVRLLSSASVRWREIWSMNVSSGCGVEPTCGPGGSGVQSRTACKT
jgi:hypothetical protein